MTIRDPNTTLLQAKDQFPSDKTPAQLTGPKNFVTFADKVVGPPASLYIQRDDNLSMIVIPDVAPQVFTLTARVLRPDTGEIISHQFLFTANTPYALNTFTTNLDEGFLLSIVVQTSPSAGQTGECFVTALLNRNLASATFGLPGQILIRDYVTTLAPATWPGGRMTLPTEGPGRPRVITIANPAAGADWAQVVQVIADWELIAFNAIFTASAGVANRQVQLILDDSATAFFVGDSNVNIVATNVANVSGAQLTPNTGIIATDVSLPIPPRNLLVGLLSHRIRVLTAGIQAGDQWSAIRLLVREWIAD